MIGRFVDAENIRLTEQRGGNLEFFPFAHGESMPASGHIRCNAQCAAETERAAVVRVEKFFCVIRRNIDLLFAENAQAVRTDAAAVRMQKTADKFQQSAFAAAVRSDNAGPTA